MVRTALGTRESFEGPQLAARNVATNKPQLGSVSDDSEDGIGPQKPRTPDGDAEIKHLLPRIPKPQSQKEKPSQERDTTSEDDREEEQRPVVPLFRAALPPDCAVPPASDHLQLAWQPLGCTGYREPLPPDLEEPEIDIGYLLQKQEVGLTRSL